MKVSKFKDMFVQNIVTRLITSLFVAMIIYFLREPVFALTKLMVNLSLQTINIPIWLALLALVLILLSVVRSVVCFYIKLKKPNWKKYKTDTIFGVIWEWKWQNLDEPIIMADNLTCLCPKCSYELDIHSEIGEILVLHCAGCNFSKNFKNFKIVAYTDVKKFKKGFHDRVINKIQYRVITKSYK